MIRPGGRRRVSWLEQSGVSPIVPDRLAAVVGRLEPPGRYLEGQTAILLVGRAPTHCQLRPSRTIIDTSTYRPSCEALRGLPAGARRRLCRRVQTTLPLPADYLEPMTQLRPLRRPGGITTPALGRHHDCDQTGSNGRDHDGHWPGVHDHDGHDRMAMTAVAVATPQWSRGRVMAVPGRPLTWVSKVPLSGTGCGQGC